MMKRVTKQISKSLKPLNSSSQTRYYSDDNKQVAVILSGCGFLDGSDVQETVSFGINLKRKGIDVTYFAPTEEIDESFNYTTRAVDKVEERYPLKESTRITRTPVMDIKKLKHDKYSSLIIPGGDGAIRNLSNFELVTKTKRNLLEELEVHSEIERVIKEFHSNSKTMILCAFSPMLACKVLGKSSKGPGVQVTFGEEDPQLKDASNLLGNEIINLTKGTEYVFDENNKIISTPLFNFSTNTIEEVHTTIKKLVDKFL
eukprot:gene8862-811_t